MGTGVSRNKTIGYERLRTYVKFAYDTNKLPFVSVGSGIGKDESKMTKEIPGIKIICVDPEPLSFNKLDNNHIRDHTSDHTGDHTHDNNRNCDCDIHMPDYPLVDDLIKERPIIVGKCNLLILWSSPNDTTYDIEAVAKLQPQTIVTIFDMTGSAGGAFFIRWAASLDLNLNLDEGEAYEPLSLHNDDKKIAYANLLPKIPYCLVQSYRTWVCTKNDRFRHVLHLYRREDTDAEKFASSDLLPKGSSIFRSDPSNY
jgi:hypothetical protein